MIGRNYLFHFALLFFTLFIAVKNEASAQDSTKSIALDEAIGKALNHNRDLNLAKLDEEIATAKFQQTSQFVLPRIDISYSALTTNNPLNAFGFKLQQGIIAQNDFNPALLNHPSGTADFMAKLEVTQPILNLDMLYMRKGSEKEQEVYKYKTQRTKEYLIFEVQKACSQLKLAYEAKLVLDEALKTANTVYIFTDNHYKQGLIQKSDLLNAELRVKTLETNQAKAANNINNASNYLSVLMGEQPLLVYKIKNVPAITLAVDSLITAVSPQRADFMAMQRALEASDLVIKASQLSYLPRLNAFGNYQFDNSSITGPGANAYLAGINLSWNVFNGNKTKNIIITQKLERKKLNDQLSQQQEQSQLELNKVRREIAETKFEIEQGKSSVAQATEAFNIVKNRYEQGLVNTIDVLMAETQLDQQKLSLIQTKFNLSIAQFYFQFLTSSTNK